MLIPPQIQESTVTNLEDVVTIVKIKHPNIEDLKVAEILDSYSEAITLEFISPADKSYLGHLKINRSYDFLPPANIYLSSDDKVPDGRDFLEVVAKIAKQLEGKIGEFMDTGYNAPHPRRQLMRAIDLNEVPTQRQIAEILENNADYFRGTIINGVYFGYVPKDIIQKSGFPTEKLILD